MRKRNVPESSTTESMSNGEMFLRSLLRPVDFVDLTVQQQWAIDEELGILDWDGGCAHGYKICDDCRKIWEWRFGKEHGKKAY